MTYTAITTGPMTPERLRPYLFDGDRVSFWNYSSSNISVGIEVEYFIAKGDEKNYELATQGQYADFQLYLERNFNYSKHILCKQHGRISKNTEFGYVAVKPDFAWHVLEIALPPRSSNAELDRLMTATFREVDLALESVGLKRLDLSCLPRIPSSVEVVDTPSNIGFLEAKTRQKRTNGFESPYFPAFIASTQIHLNVMEESLFPIFPTLFETNITAERNFCRQQHFENHSGTELRKKFWEMGMGEGYLLKSTPNRIANSLTEYCELFNQSTPLFPYDAFFPVKDLSYIRPTKYGTIEFRSACSQLKAADIIEIADFWRRSFLSVYSDRFPLNR